MKVIMAKKKRKSAKGGRSKREVTKVDYELPGGFWRQTFAVILILIAVVFVASWFGSDANVLAKLHDGGMMAFGWGVFFVPVALVFLAVKIFRAHNNKLPVVVYFAMLLLLILVSGLFGAIGYERGGFGGAVGAFLNRYVAMNLGTLVSLIVYLVLIFLVTIFVLQMSPKAAFKQKKDSVKREKRETEGEEKSGRFGGLKINSGVAVKGGTQKAPAHQKSSVFSVKNFKGKQPEKAPEKKEEEKGVLTAVSDPNWKMPSIELFEKKQSPADAGNIQQNAYIIQSTLAEFGIEVEMEGANIGPRVTQYTMKPPAGVNLSKIVARDKELALNLAVDKIRIEAPIPGTRSVGVEIPNARSADVRLRSILESEEWKKSTDPLTFAVGKDISGKSVITNLAKMPHLLIAGTTGSGKSVMTNALISSLLYRNAPSDVKLIIVDPKQVEMAQYEDIPHLLTPVITSVEKALSAMKWAIKEMERRYTEMSKERVKNIVDYNKKMEKQGTVTKEDENGNKQEHDGGKMPYIVIVIDEMADLMMMAGKDLEMLVVRIAQKGRAAGIHLVLATQRPEAKVITGLIKANIPGRIAFAVGSQIDSRIMIDQGGAEKLLGKGDMLLLTTEMMGKPKRIQGAWASDEDVSKLTDFLREQRPPEYNDEVIAQPVQIKGMGPSAGGAIGDLGRTYDPNDPIVRKAVEISINKGKFSTAMLQTYLGKGHGFVSGLAIWFEQIGVIGEANGNKPRDVLISSMEEFDKLASS